MKNLFAVLCLVCTATPLLASSCGSDASPTDWTPGKGGAAGDGGQSADAKGSDAKGNDAKPPTDASHNDQDSKSQDVTPDTPVGPTCNAGKDDCFTRRYYLLVFNPILESQGGKSLIQYRNWNDPVQLAADYVKDVLSASHGVLNYVEAGREEVDAYPKKEDGFVYTDDTFLACLSDIKKCHKPGMADGVGYAIDYPDMLSKYKICEKLNTGEIDELWAFGAPFMGMWEATQAGVGAFFTNGPVVTGTSCNRILNIMGFSYERGVAEMLEDLAHRTEGTLSNVYGSSGDWEKFTRYDKTNPGGSHCGTVHYAPNSDSDYDWGNQKTVESYCDDWLTFPSLQGTSKSVSCSTWNCDARQHKVWWFTHLPHVAGSTSGKRNNWWAYVTTDQALP